MLSRQAEKLLRLFEPNKQYPEDNLPPSKHLFLLKHLVETGYISEMRLPPEGDPAFPHGIRLYGITSAGQEALYQASCKKREKKNERIFQALLSLLSFGLGLLAEHFVGVLGWLEMSWQWLSSFLN
jgi:hypothetical protein